MTSIDELNDALAFDEVNYAPAFDKVNDAPAFDKVNDAPAFDKVNDNLLFIQNNILSYNWDAPAFDEDNDALDNNILTGKPPIIQLYLKSNNFSDIYYFENKSMLLNDLNSDYKINQKINNFNALGGIINYYEIKFINSVAF